MTCVASRKSFLSVSEERWARDGLLRSASGREQHRAGAIPSGPPNHRSPSAKLGSFCKNCVSRLVPARRRRAGAAFVRVSHSGRWQQAPQLFWRGGGEVDGCEHLVADLPDPDQVEQRCGRFLHVTFSVCVASNAPAIFCFPGICMAGEQCGFGNFLTSSSLLRERAS
jgi:hypothetical protein